MNEYVEYWSKIEKKQRRKRCRMRSTNVWGLMLVLCETCFCLNHLFDVHSPCHTQASPSIKIMNQWKCLQLLARSLSILKSVFVLFRPIAKKWTPIASSTVMRNGRKRRKSHENTFIGDDDDHDDGDNMFDDEIRAPPPCLQNFF